MGEDKVLHTRMNSVSLCVVLSVLAACAAGDDVARKPKLFYVSTSVTTSTLQTVSICHITSGTTITTCTGRKRRSIKIDVAQHAADVKPSQLNQKVQSSQKEAEKHREGRFLLYWITTTSMSTSTSFTTTVSISGKVVCTSAGITGLNTCRK